MDDSQPARNALAWAQFMALALDAEIDAIAAWEIHAVEAVEWSDDMKPETETAAQLHTIVTEVLGAQPLVRVHEIIAHGSAADELIQASEGAQMLVVGNRGHRGLHELSDGVGQLNQRDPRPLPRPHHPRRHAAPRPGPLSGRPGPLSGPPGAGRVPARQGGELAEVPADDLGRGDAQPGVPAVGPPPEPPEYLAAISRSGSASSGTAGSSLVRGTGPTMAASPSISTPRSS